MKATAHTAKIVVRSGIGSSEKTQLTTEDLQSIDRRKAEQSARLARIAARNGAQS